MIKVGTVLVVIDPDVIESSGADSEGLFKGDEYRVHRMNEKHLYVYIDGVEEAFTIEPSKGYGLSWKSFFTIKG